MYLKTVVVYGAIVIFMGGALVFMIYYFWKVRSDSEPDYRASLKLSGDVKKESHSYSRADINWSLSMETPDGTIAAQARNISLGGAFICCDKPLPPGEVFRLTIIGPENEPVAATAKVVWSNIHVPDEKVINRGMGVRFINMSDRHIRWVRQILEK